MEEEKTTTCLEQFLLDHGERLENFPDAKRERFEKVDAAIQKRLSQIDDALKKLNGHAITITNISKDTGIARRTIYYDKLLVEYIELYSKPEDGKVVSASEYDCLKEKCDELERQNNEFFVRDITIEELTHDKEVLEEECKNLNKRNQYLEEAYANAQAKVEELNRELNKLRVVPFDGDKENK